MPFDQFLSLPGYPIPPMAAAVLLASFSVSTSFNSMRTGVTMLDLTLWSWLISLNIKVVL